MSNTTRASGIHLSLRTLKLDAARRRRDVVLMRLATLAA